FLATSKTGHLLSHTAYRRENHSCDHFFFSSRRRHTRSKRDWSSDVCSSDLRRLTRPGRLPSWSVRTPLGGRASPCRWRTVRMSRSEERRVGREGESMGETKTSKITTEFENVFENAEFEFT